MLDHFDLYIVKSQDLVDVIYCPCELWAKYGRSQPLQIISKGNGGGPAAHLKHPGKYLKQMTH